MKNIFNIMSAASFAGVVFLIGMTVYANATRQARIDENREYIKSVIEKQVYQSILNGDNVDDLVEDENDVKKAIDGFVTYLATEKLGDEVLKVLDSPMGSVEDHEGVVIRDKKIYSEPFKITGKFILGGIASDF